MPNSFPEELNHANKLMREGKFQESLKIIDGLEKGSTLSPGDRLSLLILKGKIYTITQRYGESVKVGKESYHLSKSLGRVNETLTSLLFKANCLFLRRYDKALDYLLEAEELLNSLTDASPSYLSRQRANILFRKAWAHFFKANINDALESALESLPLQEKLGRKAETAYTLQLLGDIYYYKGEHDSALDYAMRSNELFKETNNKVGLATSLRLLGLVNFGRGDLDQALEYCKESLSSKSASPQTKLDCLSTIGASYYTRGELDKALKYYKKGFTLAEKVKSYYNPGWFHIALGFVNMMKREFDLAIDYLKAGLSIADKLNYAVSISWSMVYLIMIHIEKDSLEEAQQYLNQLENYGFEKENSIITNAYLFSKALLLKKRGGSRNRTKAERLLKQVAKNDPQPFLTAFSLIYLCEFYLEELQLFDDLDVLNEIEPIIARLFKKSEEKRMYGYLAEAKLLQAKVALIQMDFEKTQRLLTQAQRIAELYGINLTAQKISNEHDKLLEQMKEWERLKEKDAPIAERLKLASIDGVLELLQGKRTIDLPDLIEEDPILLLIMSRDGISYFNYSFKEKWESSWLFSSFMAAFDTFSSELFSESIDRIKIGENIILINPIESFLVCYVIKGQSYLGLKKLNRFSTAIRDNTEIWETLKRAVKSGEELELDKPHSLGTIVNEIFSHSN